MRRHNRVMFGLPFRPSLRVYLYAAIALGSALLLGAMLAEFASRNGKPVPAVTPEAMSVLSRHRWPGNVRELINRIRRAMVMCEHRLITPADLGLERRTSGRYMLTLDKVRSTAERAAIQTALRRTHKNVSKAAQELGVDIIWRGPLREDDRASQIAEIEGFITRGVSGIVLAPLLEIAPACVIPGRGPAAEWLARCANQAIVRLAAQ